MSDEKKPQPGAMVIVGWDKIASRVVGMASGRPADKIVTVSRIKLGVVTLHEFATQEEATAFTLGIGMAWGWAQPLVKIVNPKTRRIT